ncbi:MAG: G8 domain-containing protein [Flavisolibacter sp.]
MKNLTLTTLLIFLLKASFASTITATVNNGIWTNSSTWNLNRVPANGDTITIPASKTIIINSIVALNNVVIRVNGTLLFQNSLSSLLLNTSSSIIVNSGGKVQGMLPGQQFITIGFNAVFNGSTVAGPQMANSTTGNGFTPFVPLPVKFVSFTLSHKDHNIIIQWSTSEESNSYKYIIERSDDGNNWKETGSVDAKGFSNDLTNYNYIDNSSLISTTYYRVKEVDKDGQFSYTQIQCIKPGSSKQVEISVSSIGHGKVLVQFSGELSGNVIIQYVSMSGQLIYRQVLSNPTGQQILNINASLHGTYIIAISNQQNINIARQVIL